MGNRLMHVELQFYKLRSREDCFPSSVNEYTSYYEVHTYNGYNSKIYFMYFLPH